MTNRDLLRQMTDEELAHFLCRTMEPIGDFADESCCDLCPVKELCSRGNNGFLKWLTTEREN